MQNVLPRSGARAYTVSDDASADQRYSRRGHDEQKERLAAVPKMCASVRKSPRNIIVTSRSCDVASLFRRLPCDALFEKTRV